jgi:hypothetical protein
MLESTICRHMPQRRGPAPGLRYKHVTQNRCPHGVWTVSTSRSMQIGHNPRVLGAAAETAAADDADGASARMRGPGSRDDSHQVQI